MDELVGQRLGDYRLSSLVSRGTFADTYLGTHVRTGANAAIKVLFTRLSGNEVDIFQKEAQRLAELSHPHLVRVFDFDISGGLAFLALDVFPEQLRQRYPAGMLMPVEQMITCASQLADALQYGHDKGLVHGDFRPEHIFTRPGDSQVLLSDLGIAGIARQVAQGRGTSLATSGPYQAPELPGEEPSPASDQYALAALVYELLSGELPFTDASSADFARGRLLDTLKRKVPAFMPDAGDVLVTALDRVPGYRFGRVQAFATALQLASGVQARPVSTVVPTPAPAPTVAPAPVVPTPPISAPLVQGGVQAVPAPSGPVFQPGPVTIAPAPTPQPAQSTPVPQLPYPAYPAAPAAAPAPLPGARPSFLPALTRRQMLAGLITGAAGLMVIGVTDGVVFARMNAGVAASVQPLPPTLVYTYQLQKKQGEWGKILWSSDGARLAVLPFAGLDSQLEYWDATTGKHGGTWDTNVVESVAAMWSNGKLLVVVPDKQSKDVNVVDAVSNQKILSYTGYEQNQIVDIFSANWSPDGKRVSTVLGKVDIWDATSGQSIISLGPKLVNGPDGEVYSEVMQENARQEDCAWSPDGKRMLSSSGSGILSVWDVQSGQQIAMYTKHWQDHAPHSTLYSVSIGWMVWSPNGLFIASQGDESLGSGNDSTIHVWSAVDGSRISIYNGHEGQGVNNLVWSPDSTMIASVGKDSLVHVWNPLTATKIYIHPTTTGSALAWSPQGERLASSANQGAENTVFQTWNATDGSHVVTYTATASSSASLSTVTANIITWSPDGQLIATVCEDDTVRIWRGGQE